NNMFQSMWSQAAGEGITVLVSTGDNGAPACDFPNNNPNLALPATGGLQVSGLASTPNNIAVGGTDFDQFQNPTIFWNTTNGAGQFTAKAYIKETTGNDPFTNNQFVLVGFPPLPEVNANNPAALASLIDPIGASGGKSSCTNGANTLANCAGGYDKPAFQAG